MPQTDNNRRKPAAALALLPLLASLLLVACGSSSKSGSSGSAATSPPAPASKTTTGSGKPSGSSTAALRACLRKHGVILPPSSTPAAGLQVPKGVTGSQFDSALKQCSGGNPAPKTKTAGVSKFAACMRKLGATGRNPTSPQFTAAYKQCLRKEIRGVGGPNLLKEAKKRFKAKQELKAK
jgi:hypothetical protein